MKTKWIMRVGFSLLVVIFVLAWVTYFHNEWLRSVTPKWGPLQGALAHFGKPAEPAAPDDEDVDTTKNEIPVHVAQIKIATLHRYVEGFGTVVPRPAGHDQKAGSATIASPVAGVVAKVNCQEGQKVHAGDALIQLDDRVARSTEEQADAALAQAQASLAVLKATPRPDQVQIAQLAIDKAQSAVDFAQKNYDRQKQLAADQGTAGKNVEQAASDLAGANNDLAVAKKQMTLLKSSPTPEELVEEESKVRQAEAALASARVQREMMTIVAPIDATVVTLSVNPGESVDTSRTLVQLVALDRLMVDLDVPADQLPASAEGLPAQVLLKPGAAATDASDIVPAKVTYVSPQVEAKNGSIMVGIDLPAETTLRPGQTVRVRIVAQESKDVLAVPREAVVLDENLDNVIAIVDGDQATHKTVKAGLEENGLIEISADGLKEGATVVTEGAFGLRETQATRVKVIQ